MLIVVSAESWDICDSDGPDTSEQTLYLTFCNSDNTDMLYIRKAGWIRAGKVQFSSVQSLFFLNLN